MRQACDAKGYSVINGMGYVYINTQMTCKQKGQVHRLKRAGQP